MKTRNTTGFLHITRLSARALPVLVLGFVLALPSEVVRAETGGYHVSYVIRDDWGCGIWKIGDLSRITLSW